MASNIELAKQELNKVGAILSKEISNPAVKKVLLKLKAVNTDLTNIINGVTDDFSFDDFDEGTQPAAKRVVENRKVDKSFGVDLGGFDNFVGQKDPDAFDWRQTMREANGTKDMDLGDWDPSSPANANTLGRMIDRT